MKVPIIVSQFMNTCITFPMHFRVKKDQILSSFMHVVYVTKFNIPNMPVVPMSEYPQKQAGIRMIGGLKILPKR